jgi:hypothetical protein
MFQLFTKNGHVISDLTGHTDEIAAFDPAHRAVFDQLIEAAKRAEVAEDNLTLVNAELKDAMRVRNLAEQTHLAVKPALSFHDNWLIATKKKPAVVDPAIIAAQIATADILDQKDGEVALARDALVAATATAKAGRADLADALTAYNKIFNPIPTRGEMVRQAADHQREAAALPRAAIADTVVDRIAAGQRFKPGQRHADAVSGGFRRGASPVRYPSGS